MAAAIALSGGAGSSGPAAAEPAEPARSASATAPVFGLAPIGPDGLWFDTMFSRIWLTDEDGLRTVWFERDNGDRVIETQLDVRRPGRLIVPYTKTMFASHLIAPRIERVLIVGLGGGAMVRFLEVHQPALQVDVVEIDPKVVQLAADYFGTREKERVKIITADAFDFLGEGDADYDVIYMDAFLKPSADTDTTGVPLRLKTLAFYEDLKARLRPDGLVVFNLNLGGDTRRDVETIRGAFPHVYRFRVPISGNLIVVAATAAEATSADEMNARARVLDERWGDGLGFSFAEVARRHLD